MFNFGTTAVGMHNFGVMARYAVVVFVELPRQLRIVLQLVLGEVLKTGLKVELTREIVKQGWKIPS